MTGAGIALLGYWLFVGLSAIGSSYERVTALRAGSTPRKNNQVILIIIGVLGTLTLGGAAIDALGVTAAL